MGSRVNSDAEANGAGAALVSDRQTWLAEAGFRQIEIKPRETSRALISEWTEDTRAGNFVVSALITATKIANAMEIGKLVRKGAGKKMDTFAANLAGAVPAAGVGQTCCG